ncbi:hypothetical protein HOY80DRAFT_1134910 [Tuber brumale]|nr:hypothetical protein HOY80DRAFT_1134910 [Tuber brumale]
MANPGKLTMQGNRSPNGWIRQSKSTLGPRDGPAEPPALVVAVIGPAGMGKPSLVQSLVKRYTKHTAFSIPGPSTVVTIKKRSHPFPECENELWLERQILEFPNVIAMHGLPSNICDILTHLDLFKSQCVLRAIKKPLKYRLQSELFQGPKLLCLFGVVKGQYPHKEIHSLSRFIAVIKTQRPLVGRDSDYYRLAYRTGDLTERLARVDGAKAGGRVAWDWYVRGLGFPIEVAGLRIPCIGDWAVSCVQWLQGPCPSLARVAVDRVGRKRLGDKPKLIYARLRDGSRLVA